MAYKTIKTLDEDSEIAARLVSRKDQLLEVMANNDKSMAVTAIPYKGRVYIYKGKPPNNFKFAWLDLDNKIHWLIPEMEKNGEEPRRQRLARKFISACYCENTDKTRYSHSISDKKIWVVNSELMGRQIAKVLFATFLHKW